MSKVRQAASRKTRRGDNRVISQDSPLNNSVFNVEGYEPLGTELLNAYVQASAGKGKERHANNKPFDRQPILEVGRIVGHAFAAGQAMKKIGEASQMHDRGLTEDAIHELHGAMNYCAAAIMLMREAQAK